MITPAMIIGGEIKAGSSSNIYTWQQMMGTEKLNLIFPAVKDYFDHKRECYNTGTVIKGVRVGNATDCDLSFYDLHDGECCIL